MLEYWREARVYRVEAGSMVVSWAPCGTIMKTRSVAGLPELAFFEMT